jgi:hypothetical protein
MEACTGNDIEKTRGLADKFMATGGVIGKAGVNLLIQY